MKVPPFHIPVVFSSLPFQLRIIAKEPKEIFGWASRLTSHGLSLIVFPEGTRSQDGCVGRFKGGSFYLALEAELPIVPLSIIGSRHVMLKGRLATYPADVALVVHEPIDTSGMSGADAKAFGERVRQIIKPAAESDCGSVTDDLHARA